MLKVPSTTPRRHMKRYHVKCEGCGRWFYAAMPTAHWHRSCYHWARRQRIKAEQLAAEQEAARLIDEQRRAAEEAERRAKWESEAPARAARQQKERAEQAANDAALLRKQTKVEPCPVCDGDVWIIKRPGFLAKHGTLVCAACGNEKPWEYRPAKCPTCAQDDNWHLNRLGIAVCHSRWIDGICGQRWNPYAGPYKRQFGST